MLYREIITVGSQIHTKHTQTLCGQKQGASRVFDTTRMTAKPNIARREIPEVFLCITFVATQLHVTIWEIGTNERI